MKIYVLSLKHSLDRRVNMGTELDKWGLEFEFIDAINGQNLTDIQLQAVNSKIKKFKLNKYCGSLNYGELGCALSHLKIYQKIIENNIPIAFILEDDVEFTDDFIKIKEFIKRGDLPSHFDLLLLGFHRALGGYLDKAHLKYFNRIKILTQTISMGYPICNYFGTYGYIITNQGARKILEIHSRENLILKADNFLNYCSLFDLDLKVTEYPLVKPGKLAEKTTLVSDADVIDFSVTYKHRFTTSFLYKKLVIINSWFYKLGLLKHSKKKKGFLQSNNFDEIRGEFVRFE